MATSEGEDRIPAEITVCVRLIRSFEYRNIKVQHQIVCQDIGSLARTPTLAREPF